MATASLAQGPLQGYEHHCDLLGKNTTSYKHKTIIGLWLDFLCTQYSTAEEKEETTLSQPGSVECDMPET